MSLRLVDTPTPHADGLVVVCAVCGLQPWSCLREQYTGGGTQHTQTLHRIPAAQAQQVRADADRARADAELRARCRALAADGRAR